MSSTSEAFSFESHFTAVELYTNQNLSPAPTSGLRFDSQGEDDLIESLSNVKCKENVSGLNRRCRSR